MRLAVVGSTNITLDQKALATTIIKGFIWEYSPVRVISGGARGIDSVANVTADYIGIPTSIHMPENPRWEPNGYKERNTKIAQDCTHLLCIRTQQSQTYGSGWTADLAERLGKTVWRVILP